MRVLFLTSFIAATFACQQPVERPTPSTDQTTSTAPGTTPGTPPGTTPGTPPGTTPADTEDSDSNENSGDDSGDDEGSRVNAAYNASVEYFASFGRDGKFARITVEVQEATDSEYLDLQLAFRAERSITTGERREKRPFPQKDNRKVTVYPQLLVTLPAQLYKVGTHENAGIHFHQLPPSPTDTNGNYHVKLNQMGEGQTFRLRFLVDKSALRSGQLSNSFSLHFDSPHFKGKRVQFRNDRDEIPSAGSFPRQ